MQLDIPASEKPSLTLLDSEADILADLALACVHKSPVAARLLLQELDRASTASAGELPDDVVTMGSLVVFRDEMTGETHSVQLVYPKDADMEAHRLSILTPIGAALIGMKRGSAIDWPNRRGVTRRLTIADVHQPPCKD